MASEHIIKSYDQELQRLDKIDRRDGRPGRKPARRRDRGGQPSATASSPPGSIEGDAQVDELEREVDSLVVRLLALRQPMARDLRQIVAALKIGSDLERIGDYAANVAKRSIALDQMPPVQPVHALPRMAQLGAAA